MTSNTANRRERGYNHEKKLVNFINQFDSWFARRLGGSSTGLPDVLALGHFMVPIKDNLEIKKGVAFVMECKSSTSNYSYIPNDQVVRCNEVAAGLEMYEAYITFAFKFSRVGLKDKKTGVNAKRKLKEYYFVFYNLTNIDNIENVRCDYDGKLTVLKYDKDIPVVSKFKKLEKKEHLLEFARTAY